MATKVLETSPSGFEMLRAARTLGVPTPGGTLMLEGDTDIAALWDFSIGEFRVQGRTLVETCDPADAGLTAHEANYLEAFRRSRTSLFLAVRVVPDAHQIVLRDILEPTRPEVFLTDINLSGCFQRFGTQALFFLRALEVGGFCMSSGLMFAFDPVHHNRLVQSFQQKMKKVAQADWNERKFIFFFDKHRQFGLRQGYADVPPV